MSTCTINADGTFVMNDAAPGPNKVVVDTESLKTESALPSNATPEQKKMMKEGQEMGQKLGGTKTGGTYVQIPAKYRDVKSTPLTYDVTEGKQTKDFDLPD
ncbi:MAG TPA: hypothetical protein VKS79_07265 [Gemmataceae bacterium]|nr:hypothetical protein [Gemmataceae bacterium]